MSHCVHKQQSYFIENKYIVVIYFDATVRNTERVKVKEPRTANSQGRFRIINDSAIPLYSHHVYIRP